jgi:uncharacterized protein (TIGR02996 family)
VLDIQQAFLADIIENPQDDDIRLIYADWLEEHGDLDRAEFIRVQIRLATMRAYALAEMQAGSQRGRSLCLHQYAPIGGCLDCRDLVQLEYELLRFHAKRWVRRPLPKELHGASLGWDGKSPHVAHLYFHRGFVAEIRGKLDKVMEYLPGLVKIFPIETVLATDKRPNQDTFWLPEDGMTYEWLLWDIPHVAQDLPWELGPHLTGTKKLRYVGYLTQQEAFDDLSRGLLKWAKQQSKTVSSQT